MAPMAGRVSDAEEDGLVLLLSPVQSFLSPWIPIHRIMGMLQEIGARLMDQSVCILGVFFHSESPPYSMTISPSKFNIKMGIGSFKEPSILLKAIAF
jgi:hypothetical protein